MPIQCWWDLPLPWARKAALQGKGSGDPVKGILPWELLGAARGWKVWVFRDQGVIGKDRRCGAGHGMEWMEYPGQYRRGLQC